MVHSNEQRMITYRDRELLVGREYDVPASLLWEILTDTRQWPLWGPSLTQVECSDRFITVGSSGRVRTVLGIWLPFTITGFKHMQYWGWRIGRFNATGHQLTLLQPERCRLTFSMPWWAAPYLVVCFIALQRIKKITRDGEVRNTPRG